MQTINRYPGSTPVSVYAAGCTPDSDKSLAHNLTAKVFRYADMDHPAVATLFALGKATRAARLSGGVDDPIVKKELAFFQEDPVVLPLRRTRPAALDPDSIVTADMELPSPPRIYAELQQAIMDPRLGAIELGKIIAKDVSLAAKLLRMVNSPYYGAQQKVDSISRAVAMMGLDQISMLATAICVMNEFNNIPKDLIDLDSFWRHSLSAGILARLLAKRVGLRGADYYFLAGLMHDIGRLILFKGQPELAGRALSKAREQQIFLHYAEQEEVGYDHSTLGSVLFRKWQLPTQLRLSVLYHHDPDISEQLLENSVVHMADIITHALGYGLSGEYFMPPLCESAWEALRLSPENLQELAKQAEQIVTPLFASMS